jgi:hypothetical protein
VVGCGSRRPHVGDSEHVLQLRARRGAADLMREWQAWGELLIARQLLRGRPAIEQST